jgi:hypothetical protein
MKFEDPNAAWWHTCQTRCIFCKLELKRLACLVVPRRHIDSKRQLNVHKFAVHSLRPDLPSIPTWVHSAGASLAPSAITDIPQAAFKAFSSIFPWHLPWDAEFTAQSELTR